MTKQPSRNCPVSDFVDLELRLIEEAKAEHKKQCQLAEKAGLPPPDLDDLMPELVWTKLHYP